MAKTLPERVSEALRQLAARPDPAAELRELVPDARGPFEPLGPRPVTDEMIVAWIRARVPALEPWPDRPCCLVTELHALVLESGGRRSTVDPPEALLPLFHRPVQPPSQRPKRERKRTAAYAVARPPRAPGELAPGTLTWRVREWLRAHPEPVGYTLSEIALGLGPPEVKYGSMAPTLCKLVALGWAVRARKGRYAVGNKALRAPEPAPARPS